MRVSIWQQWASNHSADFTVVGKFTTAAQARHVAAEITAIIRRIENWWAALSPEECDEWITKLEPPLLTPPEEELRDKYGIEWSFNLDWYFLSNRFVDEPVTIIDRVVIVRPPDWQIWYGPQPFNDLLAKLGGEIAFYVDESKSYPTNKRIVTFLSCTALDEETRHHICTEIERAKSNKIMVPAWIIFHSGERDPEGGNLLREGKIYLEYEEAVAVWHSLDIRPRNRGGEKLLREAEIRLNNLRKQLPHERHNYIEHLIYGTRIYLAEQPPEIACQDLRITINELRRFDIKYFMGLRAMIAWLHDLGCTEIDYTFEMEPGN